MNKSKELSISLFDRKMDKLYDNIYDDLTGEQLYPIMMNDLYKMLNGSYRTYIAFHKDDVSDLKKMIKMYIITWFTKCPQLEDYLRNVAVDMTGQEELTFKCNIPYGQMNDICIYVRL